MISELDSWMGCGSFPGLPLVRVIVAPSFQPQIEYAAFAAAAMKVAVVRHVVRALASEAARGEDAVEGAESAPEGLPGASDRVLIDESELVSVCASLRAAPLPAMPRRSSMGLDGTTFEVVLGHWPTRAQFSWWTEVPEGWEPLGDFVREFTQLVDRSVGPHVGY